MRQKLVVQYDISKYDKPKKPLSLQSFAIREVDGSDEERAAISAKAKGGAATVYEELVRLSIVEVDGSPVNHDGMPLTAYDSWNSRTRVFVLNAFRALNGIDEKEETSDFLESGQAR